jgi:hypothetical protein
MGKVLGDEAATSGEPAKVPSSWLDLMGGGALGVGTVLVFLPMLAIVAGAIWFRGLTTAGLPVLAILGIMILLGTLALVAMLFKQLELTNRDHPLALPPGSMRATIALSLIVLFAIISITLYTSIADGGKAYRLTGLQEGERNQLVMTSAARVLESMDDSCAKPVVAPDKCAKEDLRFAVVLRPAPSSEAVDLAKQLLVLVGTLMTSVTSFYFAARSDVEAKTPATERDDTGGQANTPSSNRGPVPHGSGGGGGQPLQRDQAADSVAPVGPSTTGTSNVASAESSTVTAPAAHQHVGEHDADGCDVAIVESTPDVNLPKAEGGIAAPERGG